MNKEFQNIVGGVAKALYDNDLDKFSPIKQQYILSQYVMRNIANLFNDKSEEEVLKTAIDDAWLKDKFTLPLTVHNYKNIFEYPSLVQPKIYGLEKNIQIAQQRNDFALATAYINHKNHITRNVNINTLINGDDNFNNLFMRYLTTNDRDFDRQFLNLLSKYGSTKKDNTTKYVLWISEKDNSICEACAKRNGQIYLIQDEPERPHPNCRCRMIYFGGTFSEDISKKYLVVIFSGINTEADSQSMVDLGKEITNQLNMQNEKNQVDVLQLNSYNKSENSNVILDIHDFLGDISQVAYRAYLPSTTAIRNFANQVKNTYNSGNYDYVFFVGYSGGGVMASRVAEVIEWWGGKPNIDKIVRIGSPELNVNVAGYASKTHDIIISGDPVPLVEFKRLAWDIKANNEFLLDIEGLTWDLIKNHGLYFSDIEDADGVSNLTKTVRAILGYIK